jgi:hypothetical protein
VGLLDPKSRVLDVVLTDQGRRALAKNDFKISFYSLSDGAAFYQGDIASGSADATSRVYAECATDLPQDIISLLVNDARQITGMRSTVITGSTSVYGGQLLRGSTNSKVLTGSDFTTSVGQVMSSSLENLRNNFVLGSVDDFFQDDEFVVAPTNVSFTVGESPGGTASQTVNVSALEGFFQDPLLSHIPNFMYLPPVNKPSEDLQAPALLGEYSSLGGDVTFDYADVRREMNESRKQGRLRTFKFDPAPRDNNIHLQIFEQTSSGLSKLDVVDFGTYRGDSGNPVRVVFAGKVYLDDFGVETFARLFTITLE